MFYAVSALTIIYFIFAAFLLRRLVVRMQDLAKQKAEDRTIKLEEKAERKKRLNEERAGLEDDAVEIFTLYEMTKEITSTITDDDAFKIFKTKLKEHVNFRECLLNDPLIEEDKELCHKEGVFTMTLKDKNQKLGILVIDGVEEKDRETLTILANQFALALRRVKLYEEIEKIAVTDGLTDLSTRRYFFERFAEEIERSKSKKTKLSFLMIDVDFFKKFNDDHGHLAGDQILREVAMIIKESIREIDIAGRYGGEEFCVVLPETDKDGAYFAAERIRASTEKTKIKAYDVTVNATLSIGIATFPDDSKTQEELIDKADWALYRAKKRGRNRVCSFGVIDYR
ncbi:MAG: GGDEF domain-containing protein [Candidatus Omnitrophica bacterium]|nr:GGDEF domain-containing protein [Candidatus Omnitrophota bacterium]